MIITKSENPDLVRRQLLFFEAVDSSIDICHVALDEYRYHYLPGVSITDVSEGMRYLEDHVWSKPPLLEDVGDYTTYISEAAYASGIEIKFWLLGLINDVSSLEDECLVHGDATYENLQNTWQGVESIDPGVARGFNNQWNDIGKLLQSSLTHWESIRHGSLPRELGLFPVCTYSAVSLYTHWVRLLKHRERHPDQVYWYGRTEVIPLLEESIKVQSRRVARDTVWPADVIQRIHHRLATVMKKAPVQMAQGL